jgi:hypothetical protein
MVGFNEMHRFYYEFQATCLLVFVTLSQLIKPAPFTFCFFFCGFSYENVRITYHFFSSKKYSHSNIHNKIFNQSTNLHNFTTVHTPYYIDANPDEKGCITASKLIKESEKYCKSYLVSMNRLFCDSHDRE